MRNIRAHIGFLGNYAYFVAAGLGFQLRHLYQMESKSSSDKRLGLGLDLDQIETYERAGLWEGV